MLLSDKDIRAEVDGGRVRLDPWDPAMVQPSSIDVRLDRYFRLFDNHKYPYIDPAAEQPDLTRLVEVGADEDGFVLHPGEFVLGSTWETVTLPDDLAARVEGKIVARAARPAHARDGGLRRPRLLRPRDARALQRGNPADHALPGHEDRAAVLLPPELSRREPLWQWEVRVALPRAARPDCVTVVPELPPQPGVSAVPTGGRMPLASLAWDARPARAGAVVLVMHGGAVNGREANRAWSHNVARLVPFARALKQACQGRSPWRGCGSATAGGTGSEASPVEDARWALAQVRAEYPGVPSRTRRALDGRADRALRCRRGRRPARRRARPWVEHGDPLPGDGQTVLIHGDRDVITPLSGSRRIVEGLRSAGRDATLIRVQRSDHAMIVRARLWTALVVDIVAAVFARELGGSPEPHPGPIGAVVAQTVHGGGGILDI